MSVVTTFLEPNNQSKTIEIPYRQYAARFNLMIHFDCVTINSYTTKLMMVFH